MPVLEQVLLVLCISFILNIQKFNGLSNSIPHCQKYDKNDNKKCLSCESGYHIANNTCEQNDCMFGPTKIANCVACSSEDPFECVECNEKYHKNAEGKCEEGDCTYGKTKIEHCLLCDFVDQAKCGGCETGYKRINDGSSCVELECRKDNPFCIGCSDIPSVCNWCKSGYHLDKNNKCVPGDCTQTTPNCDGCSSDGNECTICNAGFHKENDACVPGDCLNGEKKVNNCSSCRPKEREKCYDCKRGFKLIDNTCAEIKCEIEHCKYCSDDNQCSECESGFHLSKNGTECLVGDCKNGETTVDNCSECVEGKSENCKQCNSGFHLIQSLHLCEEGDCLKGFTKIEHCIKCAPDYFYDYDEKAYIDIPPSTPRCAICEEGYKPDRYSFNCVSFSFFMKINKVLLSLILTFLI